MYYLKKDLSVLYTPIRSCNLSATAKESLSDVSVNSVLNKNFHNFVSAVPSIQYLYLYSAVCGPNRTFVWVASNWFVCVCVCVALLYRAVTTNESDAHMQMNVVNLSCSEN